MREIDPVLLGDVFYGRLFIDNPALQSLFKSPMDEQYKKLIDTISVVVARLENLPELIPDIQALAQRHVQYGVKPEQYDLVGAALLWTLEKGLGRDWTPAAAEAWSRCYHTLAQTMINSPASVDSPAV
ncbi:globin domain-containing protein [Arsenicibacter rosenii]|uniref:globin domain-containing protein n=1 Tax=Arsenicibacter rosenii TaxID=1750698 RepID=UPI001E30A19F|nr:globin domain-containing protein [Arsenicibacter rosenii]